MSCSSFIRYSCKNIFPLFGSLLIFVLSGCQSLQNRQTSQDSSWRLKNTWTRQTTLTDNIQFRSYLLSAPVVYKDLVIAANSYDGVVAFTKENGEREWRFESVLGSDSGLALFEDNLFFITNQGELINLDPNNGRIKWKFSTNAEGFSAPVVLKNRVIFMTSDGRLFALDIATGQQQWNLARTSETNLSTRAGASLTSDDKDIYAAFPNGSVVKLSADKGTPVWETKIPGGLRFKDVDTTPLLIDQKVIVSGFETGVYALDASSGQILWNNEIPSYQALVKIQKNILVADLKGSLHTVETSTGATLKSFQLGHSPLGQPLVLDDHVLVSESSGPLRLVSMQTGKTLSQFDTGHGVSAPFAYDKDENTVFAVSQSSNLYKILIRPESFGKVWSWEN